jgi:7,8-dihydropterin-6-yl-methyl-4-(beta-D-ribofuranosyl)aminobenzene 5'-phosphate synthase
MQRGLVIGLVVVGVAVVLLFVGQRVARRALSDSRTQTAADRRAGSEDVAMSVSDKVSHVAGDSLEFLVTYDNNPLVEGFVADWGFSCIVKGAGKTILFDTGGNGSILMTNMARLGVSPGEVDVVVLSHAHGDHTGGIETFLDENPDVSVFVPVSFRDGFKRMLVDCGARVVEVGDATEICRGVYSTGEAGQHIREQSLIVNTDRGAIVITGCAHPGIVTIVKRAAELTGGTILLAMGGFHMVRAEDREIKGVISDLRKVGVEFIAPCHCSGDRARDLFEQEWGDRYIEVGVGKVLKGGDLSAP